MRLLHQTDAGGHWDFSGFGVRNEFSVCGVDLENRDVVAGHVGAEKPLAIWGDEKILRTFPAAGCDGEPCEGSVVRDAVGGDAVVAAVCAVEESSVRGDFQVCGVAFSGEVGGQGGEGLPVFECAVGCIPIEEGDGVCEFVDDVDDFAVGMECEVAGSATGREFDVGLVWVGDNFAGVVVDGVDQDFVDTEVGGECEASVGAGDETVCIGSFLARGVCAFSCVLDGCDRGFEGTVGVDGIGCDVSGGVVGDEDGFAVGQNVEVAGGGAVGALAVEKAEVP